MNKSIKTAIILLTVSCSLLLLSSTLFSNNHGDKTFVILLTNDMHAQIDRFPELATAIELCRDTTDVVLVDAGDRWTGNAFVDLVDHYAPIYELMNYVGYDVVTYGNHEFDKGQAYVAAANRQATFPTIGSSIVSDTTSFPQPAAHHIVKVGGKKIAFVGVVGNYDANNHPAGKDESFAGISFIDPHTAAAKYTYLADESDMLILLSHSGLERDIEFAQSPLSAGYDQIISAHSHDEANQIVEGKLITQTGSRLKNIGATTVTITAQGEVKLSYRNIPLSNYEKEPTVAKMVASYNNNPELNLPIGKSAAAFDIAAIRNLFAETIRSRTNANIGIYHVGGIRISQLPEGDISMANILNAEPFSSYIATCSMTVNQLRKFIMAKFNDTVNVGESHHIDLITTTPYTIVIDESGDAIDVRFPALDENRIYRIAMGDYMYKTYRGLDYTNGEITEKLVAECVADLFKKGVAVAPDSVKLQEIVKE